MSIATPTPWFVYSQNSNMIVNAAATKVIADASSEEGDYAEAKANAAFIVRACNAHDQLVAALRAVLLEIGDYGRPSVRADARKALAAAGAA